ncbi:MAG: class I SAM-dependent methyltransferase [Proteocatella sp.]
MKTTLEYYKKNALEYVEKTKSADMSSIINRFKKYMKPNGYILDLGCGSGRDSKYFIENGFTVEALDASESIASLAQIYLKQNVRVLDFRKLDYYKIFDGVWACASLLHLTPEEMESILDKIYISLKKEGCFYLSVKEGSFEGYINGRYFTYYTKESLSLMLQRSGFIIEEIWITEDVLSERAEKWINVIAGVRKP